jgi:purine-binding chemotaxis protein CheW
LASEEYAIPISQVKEIIQYNGATSLPRTFEYMEGIINLRGKVIPVVNLAVKLAIQTEKNFNKRVLIVEAAENDIGIVVDEVKEVIRLEDTAIEAITCGITNSNEFIKGIGKTNGRLLIILDMDKLFSKEEIKILRDSA